MNIAVFVSGNGSNLQALMAAEEQGLLQSGQIKLVVSDKADAYAIKRAEERDVEVYLQEKEGYSSREEYDKRIIETLREKEIELVVLAGFMRILSGEFIEQYGRKIINIHPSLLPAFKGANGIKDAWEKGVKLTGVTVHFVTEELDSGPIILQKEVRIEERDTEESVEDKIHRVEHELYPEAVRLFAEGKLEVEGDKVKIV